MTGITELLASRTPGGLQGASLRLLSGLVGSVVSSLALSVVLAWPAPSVSPEGLPLPGLLLGSIGLLFSGLVVAFLLVLPWCLLVVPGLSWMSRRWRWPVRVAFCTLVPTLGVVFLVLTLLSVLTLGAPAARQAGLSGVFAALGSLTVLVAEGWLVRRGSARGWFQPTERDCSGMPGQASLK